MTDKTSNFPKLLKRSEAARVLGISVSTLRRREGELIQPVIGANGVHLFEESELKAVMVTVRHRQAISSMGPSAGDVAAEVFTLLDERMHPADIVKRLRLAPDIVTALHEQWTRMHEAFVVTRDEAEELGMHARTRRARSAREAVAQVKARVDALVRLKGSPRCRFCGDQSACACESCAVQARGPLWTGGVKLETRRNEAGLQECRIVAIAMWDETLGEASGSCIAMRSDWYLRDQERSPLAEFFAALEGTRQSHDGGHPHSGE
jgi:hypothetical protein